MKINIQKIEIPARKNTSATNLGIRLVYKNQQALESLPYMFILPGGPGANHSFYTDYDCLHEVANLIYYDPRGCGLSDQSDASSYTMDIYIDDIHSIKKTLKLHSIIPFGTSYGAFCALGYALRYPNDVSKLILAAGASTHEFIKTAQTNLIARGTNEQNQICDLLWKGSFKNDEQIIEYLKIMASMYSWKIRNNQPIADSQPTHRLSFEALNEGFKNNFWEFNYTKQLDSIHCNTLILVGEEDWITDPKYSKEMATQIPNNILHIFKNSDHSMDTDVPDLFFGSIKAFI